MATASSFRRHAGTSATLLVAVGSAAYLVVFGGDTAAACPRPLTRDLSLAMETTMPTIKSLGDQVAALLRRWTKPQDSLRSLDARTLADIGIHPSEIDSIEAESHGASALSRRRIVSLAEVGCHG
jgi:uncharacterized protein YjiS (DUF1127 family)